MEVKGKYVIASPRDSISIFSRKSFSWRSEVMSFARASTVEQEASICDLFAHDCNSWQDNAQSIFLDSSTLVRECYGLLGANISYGFRDSDITFAAFRINRIKFMGGEYVMGGSGISAENFGFGVTKPDSILVRN